LNGKSHWTSAEVLFCIFKGDQIQKEINDLFYKMLQVCLTLIYVLDSYVSSKRFSLITIQFIVYLVHVFYFILFCSVLFLFYFILFCFVLFCFVLFCFVLFVKQIAYLVCVLSLYIKAFGFCHLENSFL
jgi:hypothetical protein